MALQWRAGGFLVVERCPPRMTAVGKVLHLHRDAPRHSPSGVTPHGRS
jgi:hypothetical protein